MLAELLYDLQLAPQVVDIATEPTPQRHNIRYHSVSLGIDSLHISILPYGLCEGCAKHSALPRLTEAGLLSVLATDCGIASHAAVFY
jgi:hypothetical protein